MRNSWRWFRDRTTYSGTKWFILSVLLVLGMAAILSPLFWGDLSGSCRGSPDSTGSTIRNVVLIVGAVLALPLAVWRGKVAENQVEATEKSVRAAQQAIANQRFQGAAEALGHELNAVRLGAIRNLRQLSREYPIEYYVDVMTLLAAFVRQPHEGSAAIVQLEKGKHVREDVQVAIRAIGTRSKAEQLLEVEADYRIDLSDTTFRYFDFRGLNMQRVLFGRSTFHLACLVGTDLENADLTDTDFLGTDLRRANLANATLDSSNLSQYSISEGGDYKSRLTEDYRNKGLVQAQLDSAFCNDGSPPKLRETLDAASGEQLLWEGEVT